MPKQFLIYTKLKNDDAAYILSLSCAKMGLIAWLLSLWALPHLCPYSLILWVLLKIFFLSQIWSIKLHFLEVDHCHVMVLWLHPSLFFLGESVWTLAPKTWLYSFYLMLIFSLPVGEVCQKILLCSLFWVPSLILDHLMIHQKSFC